MIAVEEDGQTTLEFCVQASGTCTGRPEGWDLKYDVSVVGDVISGTTGVRWDGAHAGLLEVTALHDDGTLTGTAYWEPGCPGGCYWLFEVMREP